MEPFRRVLSRRSVAPDGRRAEACRGVAACLAIAMLLAACSSAPPSPSPTPSSDIPKVPSTSTFGRLFAQVRDDGTVSQETALQAFALAIAPLPGVTLPQGDPPALYERISGSFAIDWLLPYYDQLTADQRAAVDRAIAPFPDRIIVSPESSTGIEFAGLFARTPTAEEQVYIDALADADLIIAKKLGRKLTVPYSLALNETHQDPNAGALAYATPLTNRFRGLIECAIHVEPELRAVTDKAELRASLAHEMFHCYQHALLDTIGLMWTARPSWLIEGQAEWAGEAALGPSDFGRDWWAAYLESPGTPLFTRTYDAVGFYEHMAEKSIDPWTHFDKMLLDANNVGAYKAAEAPRDDFLDTWASGLFRESLFGEAWYAEGRWQTAMVARPDEMTLANDEVKPVSAGYVANVKIHLVPSADIVETRIEGHARLHAGSVDDVGLQQRFYCTRLGGCTCPAGQRWTGPDTVAIPPDISIALTGSLDTTTGQLRGHGLDEYCKPAEPTPPAGPPCGPGCGGSNGDPHLRTIDGWRYDLMAAGEYVLLRSPDGAVEIQARQEPPDEGSGVTLNTAAAARVNGHRVAFYVAAGAPSVRVDGAAVDASAVGSADLGRGARLSAYQRGFELDFPDGTKLWALSLGKWGINLLVLPSAALRADGVGLLANVPLDAGLRVPALPDGSRLPSPANDHERYELLYGRFAPAWLVTAETSLFDYEAGETTDGFALPGFPAEAAVRTLEQLTPGELEQARTACAGVGDVELQEDCVYDVAVTGASEYVTLYGVTQALQERGPVVLDEPLPTPPPTEGFPPGFSVIAEGVGELSTSQVARTAPWTAFGPDDTLYLSIGEAAPETDTGVRWFILAIDPSAGAVARQAEGRDGGAIAFAAGSLWAGEFARGETGCAIARLDPVSLELQANVPTVCYRFGSAFAALDDAIWFVDPTGADAEGRGAHLRRIDPATNQIDAGASVELPFLDEFATITSTPDAIVYGNRVRGEFRLVAGDGRFESLGQPGDGTFPWFPAGNGVWSQVNDIAAFYTRPDGPDRQIPIDGRLVGADGSAIYADQSDSEDAAILWRYPIDGGAPTRIAQGASIPTAFGIDRLTYYDLEPPRIGSDWLVKLWTVMSVDDPTRNSLVLQAVPLP